MVRASDNWNAARAIEAVNAELGGRGRSLYSVISVISEGVSGSEEPMS